MVTVTALKRASASRISGAILVLALSVGVAACSSPQSSSVGDPVAIGADSTKPGTATTPVPAAATQASDREIARAGLAPCPASDSGVAPVAGGLPDLTLPCLAQGPQVDLSGLRGRPMLVNVWASWCGPCRAELPILGQVSEQTRGKVDFLGLNVSDTRKSALEMAGTYNMRFPSAFDPTFETRTPLRVTGVPLTLFVRADGTIAYRHNGPITSVEQLKQLIYSSLGVTV